MTRFANDQLKDSIIIMITIPADWRNDKLLKFANVFLKYFIINLFFFLYFLDSYPL